MRMHSILVHHPDALRVAHPNAHLLSGSIPVKRRAGDDRADPRDEIGHALALAAELHWSHVKLTVPTAQRALDALHETTALHAHDRHHVAAFATL